MNAQFPKTRFQKWVSKRKAIAYLKRKQKGSIWPKQVSFIGLPPVDDALFMREMEGSIESN